MRRHPPSTDPAQAKADWLETGHVSEPGTPWRLQCRLVTPLLGGGVTAGEVDEAMPVRGAAIRGQLRFWWRVSCSQPGEGSRDLFRRETELWGGIAEAGPTASKVRVRVLSVGRPQLEAAHTYQRDRNQPEKYGSQPTVADWANAYALFPAQGELSTDRRTITKDAKHLARSGLTFELEVRCAGDLAPGEIAEVNTALRWWASFGGLGARSRRGLGAIQVQGLDPVTADDVAGRGGRLVLRPPTKDVTPTWKAAVELLKAFRQGANIGRNPKAPDSKSPVGRSRWPEADAIRALAGCAHPRHKERQVKPDQFPRAAFGLPIVFHFKDAPTNRDRDMRNFDATQFDPEDHVLEPSGTHDRLASPLILRPYWNGSAWQPAALLLPGREKALTQPLKFKGRDHAPQPWPDTEPAAERERLAQLIKPMQGRGSDVLTAFLDFFEKGGR